MMLTGSRSLQYSNVNCIDYSRTYSVSYDKSLRLWPVYNLSYDISLRLRPLLRSSVQRTGKICRTTGRYFGEKNGIRRLGTTIVASRYVDSWHDKSLRPRFIPDVVYYTESVA